MNKHTPGPWEIWEDCRSSTLPVGPASGGTAVCDVTLVDGVGEMHRRTLDEGEANARLIAAAPDLYGACLKALRIIETARRQSNGGTFVGASILDDLRGAIGKVSIEDARAAIDGAH